MTSAAKYITSEEPLWWEVPKMQLLWTRKIPALEHFFPTEGKSTHCRAVVPGSSTSLSERQGSESILNRSCISKPGYSCSHQAPLIKRMISATSTAYSKALPSSIKPGIPGRCNAPRIKKKCILLNHLATPEHSIQNYWPGKKRASYKCIFHYICCWTLTGPEVPTSNRHLRSSKCQNASAQIV